MLLNLKILRKSIEKVIFVADYCTQYEGHQNQKLPLEAELVKRVWLILPTELRNIFLTVLNLDAL